ncbi:MAG: OmpA family protein [Novosphingobium sp.]|nr:OmpA family protein [Novosphingobium sp.]
MTAYRFLIFLAGAAATSVIAIASTVAHGPALIDDIAKRAELARDRAGGSGIELGFVTPQGWLTRHPLLRGGGRLDRETRAEAAAAIAAVPGIGGVVWQNEGPESGATALGGAGQRSQHCQEDVEAILKARSVRFAEASASIDPASEKLLDEVAIALKPCVGGIIAITGHTDSAGDEGANVALSRARADTIRWALIGRGIPADGLRATGKGSSEPIEGLDPADPANRRIEFSVIATMPLKPTPIDTPGPS